MSFSGLPLLRLTFLGTSAAMPTSSRNLSGLAVRAGRDLLLFDCGEGTQRQMTRFGTGFDLDGVFFTHFHADHYLGIIGFLRTCGMLGRTRPMRLYGPSPACRLLDQAVHLGIDTLAFPVEIEELRHGDVVRLDGYEVRAFDVSHRITAIGYAIVEDARPGVFDPRSAERLGLEPGPDFGRLQQGEPVITSAGRRIEPHEVMGPTRAGRHVVISGDTMPCATLLEAARKCDLLVHEATFSEEEHERALETMHSTAAGAGRLAREAGARQLVLTHFSARFEQDTAPLEAEARAAFGGPVTLAHDGLEIEVPRRE